MLSRTNRSLIAATAAGIGLMISAMAIAQTPPTPPPPIMPPSLPATYVADLMTQPVATAFGAQWKTMEAKIIETNPIPEHLPGYNTAA